MTTDFSPEGSPFKPIDETSWAHEFILADEQSNLDVLTKVLAFDEIPEFARVAEEVRELTDDALSAELADQFKDETALGDIMASLSYAQNLDEQFEVVAELTPGQKATLLELSSRLIVNKEIQS